MELFPSWVLWDGPLVSPQLGTGNIYFVLLFPPCSTSLLVGTKATRLLAAWTQPCYPEAWALMVLRRQSSCQLVAEPSLKSKHACARWSEEGLVPTVGHQRRAGSTRLTNPRGLIQNAALLCTLRLEARTEMELNIPMTLLITWLRNNSRLCGMQPQKGTFLSQF